MKKLLIIGVVMLAFTMLFSGCLQQSPQPASPVQPAQQAPMQPAAPAQPAAPVQPTQPAPTQPAQQAPVQPPSPGNASILGSAAFQQCMSKCEADISGNPSPCQDGCVEAYAAATKNITLCNTLADQTNLPSCYGTVVKAVGNISICDTLPNTTDIDYCLSEAGRSG